MVVGTGLATEIGQISRMLASVEEVDTPMLRKMGEFSRVLTLAIGALALVAFALGMWLGHYSWDEMFMVAVGIAVAAIPEGPAGHRDHHAGDWRGSAWGGGAMPSCGACRQWRRWAR